MNASPTTSSPIAMRLLPDNAKVSGSGEVLIGGCSLLELAEEYGTPLFVYDENHIRARCREAVRAFPEGAAYASKAFFCLAMARLVVEEGMNIDVATDGEMYVALSAGVSGENLILHGNNKSYKELRAAVKVGVKRIVVDSFDELDRLDKICIQLNRTPKVLLRITPGVSAHTHEFVSTGQDDTKFGFTVSSGLAAQAIERIQASAALKLAGIHAHIGSQIFSLQNLELAAAKVAEFASDYDLEEISLGGGLGVAYVEGESAPSISEWAKAVKSAVQKSGLNSYITAEPGRSIVASAAVTLYRVGTIKELEGIRTYVAVDGGMSDNPRPVLYGSGYEMFLPRAVGETRSKQITLVGKHCESGDMLVQDGWVPENVGVGDILATPVTGAYGHAMGSNYNKVQRPAAVFVKDGEHYPVITRESYKDLLKRDTGPRVVLDADLGFANEGTDEDPEDSVA